MNETLIKQESNDPTPEPKLLGRRRPLAGALIGVLIFTIILLLLKVLSESPAYLALLFPGIVAIDMLGLSDNANKVLASSIGYIISCPPSAIIGWLIISRKKISRSIGLGLLILYLIFSLGYGWLLVRFMTN